MTGKNRLARASRLVGADSDLVLWGGGNTSIKTEEQDFRGRSVPVLRVKGSGSDLKSIAAQHFPSAIQIVDLYHAREHLWTVAAWLHPSDSDAKKFWMIPMKDLLDEGKIEPLVAALRDTAGQ